MKSKTCSKCKEYLIFDRFFKRKTSKDGLQPYCKICAKNIHLKWVRANPDKYKNNRLKWIGANPDKDRINSSAWKKANPEKHRAYFSLYKKRRAATEPLFKLRQQVSSLLHSAFKSNGYSKNTKTAILLGTDFITLQAHLIQTARLNYGGKYYPNRPYQIDHVIPCASANNEAELIALQHFSNLQLLSPKHNKEKSNSLDWNVLVKSDCDNKNNSLRSVKWL